MKSLKPSMKLPKSSVIRFTKFGVLGVVALAACAAPAAHAQVVGYMTTLTIAPTGTLNLSGSSTPTVGAANGLILQAPDAGTQTTNIAKVAGYINSGLDVPNFDWLGFGITSTTTQTDAQINGVLSVMLYDNNQLGYNQWQGYTGLGTDPNYNQVLARVSYSGDFDGNGIVNSLDFALEQFYQGSGLIAQGDLDASGTINSLDYALMQYVQGNQAYGPLGNADPVDNPPGASPSAAPEPASGTLLLLGLAGVAGLRRRKSAVK